MHNSDNPRTYLKLKEAAAYLQISPHTLHRWTSKGIIPFYKPNGRVTYFRREELDAWLTHNRSAANYEATYLAESRGWKP